MEEIKISLVVQCSPAHSSSWLLEFLLSVERQTRTDFEVILSCDGPCVGLRDMVRDTRVWFPRTANQLVWHEPAEHKGFWGNPYKDVAMALCRGKYIALQNCDNWLTPVYLAELSRALDDGAHLALTDWVSCHFGYVHKTVALARSRVGLGTWMALADLARAKPWPGDYPVADEDFVLNMAKDLPVDQVVYIRKPLYTHR